MAKRQTTMKRSLATDGQRATFTYYDYKVLCGKNPGSYSPTCKKLAANSHYAAANFGKLGQTYTIHANGKSTTVTVLDRGGGVPKSFTRWMDLSPAAFADLAPLSAGRIKGSISGGSGKTPTGKPKPKGKHVAAGRGGPKGGTYSHASGNEDICNPSHKLLSAMTPTEQAQYLACLKLGAIRSESSTAHEIVANPVASATTGVGIIADALPDWLSGVLPFAKIAAGVGGMIIIGITLVWIATKETTAGKALTGATTAVATAIPGVGNAVQGAVGVKRAAGKARSDLAEKHVAGPGRGPVVPKPDLEPRKLALAEEQNRTRRSALALKAREIRRQDATDREFRDMTSAGFTGGKRNRGMLDKSSTPGVESIKGLGNRRKVSA